MSGWWLLIAVWTAFAAVWWAVAIALVSTGPPRRRRDVPPDPRTLSVFKPVGGALDVREMESVRSSVASFAAELDERSEILIGINAADAGSAQGLVEDLRRAYPSADIRLVVHVDREQYPNRKISLMKAMARHAKGELWYWSDADMKTPPGTLDALRRDYAAAGMPFVASPYIVIQPDRAPAVLDELFVNVEFYPGVLLLARFDLIRFGFGSGMLFEARLFHQHVDWDALGGCLADDYQLGQALGRGRLGTTPLETVPVGAGFGSALLHYLRWHKTIRWSRPGSYAAQLLVLPVVGWVSAVLYAPAQALPWLGLAVVLLLDAGAACLICDRLGSRLAWRQRALLPVWSLLRSGTWLACWLPWPIVWRGRRWWTPRPSLQPASEVLDPGRGG